MAMWNIHMVQRLQDSIDEVDELVVVDCYGERKQYLLERGRRNEKEKKQKSKNIQCPVRRPCKDPISSFCFPFAKTTTKNDDD
jgi:hypothetical protein